MVMILMYLMYLWDCRVSRPSHLSSTSLFLPHRSLGADAYFTDVDVDKWCSSDPESPLPIQGRFGVAIGV